jgi:hypothetical protein
MKGLLRFEVGGEISGGSQEDRVIGYCENFVEGFNFPDGESQRYTVMWEKNDGNTEKVLPS